MAAQLSVHSPGPGHLHVLLLISFPLFKNRETLQRTLRVFGRNPKVRMGARDV